MGKNTKVDLISVILAYFIRGHMNSDNVKRSGRLKGAMIPGNINCSGQP